MRLRPSGKQGPVATQARELRRLSAEPGLDLGASGADARPRRLGPAGAPARASRRTIARCCAGRAIGAQIAADVRDMRGEDREGEGDATTSGSSSRCAAAWSTSSSSPSFCRSSARTTIPRCSTRTPWLALAKTAPGGGAVAGRCRNPAPGGDALSHADASACGSASTSRSFRKRRRAALKDLLARASDMPDFATLEAMLKDTLEAVHEPYERIVA